MPGRCATRRCLRNQGHLWEDLLQPGLLGAITFTTEHVLADPAAGAAEVLQKKL